VIRRLSLARVTLCLGFADADDHFQSGSQRRFGLGLDRSIALAMHRAALGMADDHELRPGIAQHRRGNIAGEGARSLSMAILRAHMGSLQRFGHGRHQRERRRDPDPHTRVTRRTAINRARL
jgi:hypothetical protein